MPVLSTFIPILFSVPANSLHTVTFFPERSKLIVSYVEKNDAIELLTDLALKVIFIHAQHVRNTILLKRKIKC